MLWLTFLVTAWLVWGSPLTETQLVAISAYLPEHGRVFFEFLGPDLGVAYGSIVAEGGTVSFLAPYVAYQQVSLGTCDTMVGSGECSEITFFATQSDFQRLLDTLFFSATCEEATLTVTFGPVVAEVHGAFPHHMTVAKGLTLTLVLASILLFFMWAVLVLFRVMMSEQVYV
jgi:hypothetical protein